MTNSETEIPAIDWGRTDLLIELALSEDLDTTGDVTTNSVVPENATAEAVLLCKEPGMVLAGLPVAERVFKLVEPRLEFKAIREDGDHCEYGDVLAEIHGPARGLLIAERTALNFLQRLSGVATTSAKYAAALEGTKTLVLDTRKTTPGYRNLEKYAVAVGVFHYTRENVMFNLGASLCSDGDIMGRAGVSFTLGKSSKKQPLPPKDMNEVQAQLAQVQQALFELKAENKELREKLEAQR